jgi:transcriptional regulator with XRE-family HTH domain
MLMGQISSEKMPVHKAPSASHYAAMLVHLKRLREQRGLSQAQLAEAAGCSQPSISKLERGDKNVTLALVEQIAAVLGVQPWELFGIDEFRQRFLDALSRASLEQCRAVLLLLEGK